MKHNWTISTEITMKIVKVCTDFVGWSLEALRPTTRRLVDPNLDSDHVQVDRAIHVARCDPVQCIYTELIVPEPVLEKWSRVNGAYSVSNSCMESLVSMKK